MEFKIAKLKDGVSIISDNGLKVKCYFCNQISKYTQPHEYQIIDVCEKHFSMAASS